MNENLIGAGAAGKYHNGPGPKLFIFGLDGKKSVEEALAQACVLAPTADPFYVYALENVCGAAMSGRYFLQSF